MTHPSNSTELFGRVSPSHAPDDDGRALVPASVRCRRVMLDYLTDLLTPAFNQLRAAYGIEPEPLRAGPPVTVEGAKAAADEYWMLEALRAEQAKAELAESKTIMGHAEKSRRRPRGPQLDSLLKQAAKAGKNVKGAEVYQDRTVLQFGKPEAVAPEDAWPLDEFRTKETKQ